jgi:hypothetical protein
MVVPALRRNVGLESVRSGRDRGGEAGRARAAVVAAAAAGSGRSCAVPAVPARRPLGRRRGRGGQVDELASGCGSPSGSGGALRRGTLGLPRRGGGVRRCRPRGTAAPCPTRLQAAAAGTILTRSE